jgi:hypothetical protein
MPPHAHLPALQPINPVEQPQVIGETTRCEISNWEKGKIRTRENSAEKKLHPSNVRVKLPALILVLIAANQDAAGVSGK